MSKFPKDETLKIAISTAVTGAEDVQAQITLPDESQTVIDLTEIGTSAIYEASYSPAAVGTYYVRYLSTVIPAVEGRVTVFTAIEHSRTDLAGAGYDSAAHSLAAAGAKLDTIISGQESGAATPLIS